MKVNKKMKPSSRYSRPAALPIAFRDASEREGEVDSASQAPFEDPHGRGAPQVASLGALERLMGTAGT